MSRLNIDLKLSLPELMLIAGTRGMLGIGIGLLLSSRLSPEQRKAAGWALFTAGALSTIPLGFEVMSKGRLQVPVLSDAGPLSEAVQ